MKTMMDKTLHIVVCIKQVPMVSQLPWDSKTRTLKRDLAPGMMDPGSRRALEAALDLKSAQPSSITAISMGPPMAEEILHQAVALGADNGILLTDPAMAGADTYLTSDILAACIRKNCPDTDLVLCGLQTSDSETGQVGPQLAESLAMPSIGYGSQISVNADRLKVQRYVDGFSEMLEARLPALVTIDLEAYEPRYLPLSGIETAFESSRVKVQSSDDLNLGDGFNALKTSPTQIIDVYSPVTEKENHILKGPVKQVIDQLFDGYGNIISGAMGKDLKKQDGEA